MRYLGMCSLRVLLVSTFVLSISTVVNAAVNSPTIDQVVKEREEKGCKTNFTKALFNQQIIFSSERNGPEKRRIAERKITAAREKFSETSSYCEAYDEILNFNPESLERKPGDAQFKE